MRALISHRPGPQICKLLADLVFFPLPATTAGIEPPPGGLRTILPRLPVRLLALPQVRPRLILASARRYFKASPGPEFHNKVIGISQPQPACMGIIFIPFLRRGLPGWTGGESANAPRPEHPFHGNSGK